MSGKRLVANNADLIIPRLWIGNYKAAADREFLHVNNITVVFNCTKNLPFEESVPYRYRIAVDDNLEPTEIQFMIDSAEDIAYNMLREYKLGRGILVHCHAGMQRSCAATAIFLMLLNQTKAYPTMEFIKTKRPIAFHGGANFAPAIYAFNTRLERVIMPAVEAAERREGGAWMKKTN
jgi:hypothetical protein